MVEPTDGAEVESGELRWPPDEPGSPDAQTDKQGAEQKTAGEEECVFYGLMKIETWTTTIGTIS